MADGQPQISALFSEASDLVRLKEDLMDLVKCPVCLQVPSGEGLENLGRCSNGHYLCGHCTFNLSTSLTSHFWCPVCRSKFFYVDKKPNYIIHEFTSIFAKYHVYHCDNLGCTQKCQGGESIEAHRAVCVYKIMFCPVLGCKKPLTIGTVRDHEHFEVVQSRYMQDWKTNLGSRTHCWDFTIDLEDFYSPEKEYAVEPGCLRQRGSMLAPASIKYSPRLLTFAENDKLSDDLNFVPYVGLKAWDPDNSIVFLHIGWLDKKHSTPADSSQKMKFSMVVNSYLERTTYPVVGAVDACTNMAIGTGPDKDKRVKRYMTCSATTARGMDSALAEILAKKRAHGHLSEDDMSKYIGMVHWNVAVKQSHAPRRPSLTSKRFRSHLPDVNKFPIEQSGTGPLSETAYEAALVHNGTDDEGECCCGECEDARASSSSSACDQDEDSKTDAKCPIYIPQCETKCDIHPLAEKLAQGTKRKSTDKADDTKASSLAKKATCHNVSLLGWTKEEVSVVSEVSKPMFVFVNQSKMPDRFLFDYARRDKIAVDAMRRHFQFVDGAHDMTLVYPNRAVLLENGYAIIKTQYGVYFRANDMWQLTAGRDYPDRPCRGCGKVVPHLHVTVFGETK